MNPVEVRLSHVRNRPAKAGRLFNRKFENSSQRLSGCSLWGEFSNFHTSLGVSGDRSPEPGFAASEQRDFSGYSFGHKRVPPAAAEVVKDKWQLTARLNPLSRLSPTAPLASRGAFSQFPARSLFQKRGTEFLSTALAPFWGSRGVPGRQKPPREITTGRFQSFRRLAVPGYSVLTLRVHTAAPAGTAVCVQEANCCAARRFMAEIRSLSSLSTARSQVIRPLTSPSTSVSWV